jgi:hypothetical protein
MRVPGVWMTGVAVERKHAVDVNRKDVFSDVTMSGRPVGHEGKMITAENAIGRYLDDVLADCCRAPT